MKPRTQIILHVSKWRKVEHNIKVFGEIYECDAVAYRTFVYQPHKNETAKYLVQLFLGYQRRETQIMLFNVTSDNPEDHRLIDEESFSYYQKIKPDDMYEWINSKIV